MDLATYFKSGSDTAAALAERLGISAASMSRIKSGEQNISLSLAQRIVDETGGKVSLEALANARAA